MMGITNLDEIQTSMYKKVNIFLRQDVIDNCKSLDFCFFQVFTLRWLYHFKEFRVFVL